jgi:hypothetical protein
MTCHGYQGLPAPLSALVLVLSAPTSSAETSAKALVADLDTLILSLTSGAQLLLTLECIAHGA